MSPTLRPAYRPDIDGLRAIAVIAVIAYHAGLPGVSGGFVGVDIFFVISGYLITGLLLQEVERHGRVALSSFFARRVRRLLPALLTVLLCTFVGSLLVMFPQELPRLGKSGISVALISSNFHFLKYSGGYFDPATDLMPLLHTWTLAVEEQYYLIWPLIFVSTVAWTSKRGGDWKRGIRAALWTVLAVSFVLSIIETERNRSSAFYLMPFRAWEFALGGLLNFLPSQLSDQSRRVGEGLLFTGLVAIVGTVFLLHDEIPFPGMIVAVPTLGTAAVIAGGMVPAAQWPRRLLGCRPMVSIGLLSYSWYLWHWPLISLNRAHDLGARNLAEDSLLALLALALSWITYRTIEAPIRFHRPGPFSGTRGTLWLGVAMSLLVIAMATLVIEYGKRESARLAMVLGAASEHQAMPSLHKCQPDATRGTLSPTSDCTMGDPGARFGIVAWGDSHVEHWKPLLASAAPDARIIMRTLNTCPPLLGVVPYKRREGIYGCGYNNDNVLAEVQDLASRGLVQGVVLGARWNEYLAMQETDPAAMLAWALADDWKHLEKAGGGRGAVGTPPYDHAGSAATEALGLRRTLAALSTAGLRVLIIAPTPELYFNGPQCLFRRSPESCVVPRAKVDARRQAAVSAINAARLGMENVRVWDPIDEFCDDRICYTQRDGVVMYTDHNHVSPAKATRLHGLAAPHLAWLVGPSTR